MNVRTALALAALVLFCVPAAAQVPTDFGEIFRQILENETREQTRQDGAEQDVRELIDTLRLLRLAKALDLTDEETVLMVRRLDKWKIELQTLKYERVVLDQKLRKDLEQGAAPEVISKKIESLMDFDLSIAQSTRRLVGEAANGLSVEKKARFYLFIEDFDQELRRLIMRAKRHADRAENGSAKRRPREPRRPHPPATPPAPQQPITPPK